SGPSYPQQAGPEGIAQTPIMVSKAGLSERSIPFLEKLLPISEINSSQVVLDASENATKYIPGSISIPYKEFSKEDESLRPIPELAEVLGQAGVSRDDDVVVYGECLPCGGGPSAATYVYWVLCYLGHDKVKLLDGGMKEWDEAGLPTTSTPAKRPATSYDPRPRLDLLAAYDYVKSGMPQIIDARPTQEYLGAGGAIPGSVNIPSDLVADSDRIKSEDELKEVFSGISKDRPVVVYTNTGVKASVVWFALELQGYEAELYSVQDYLSHKRQKNSNT
ncbi:MAG TPA: rhodanese-like domain-containing protein, partial [Methanotrichaceae archaeon]|nr:rhodanese-like domain-containing protein [Methanotrichaceae archaeon]